MTILMQMCVRMRFGTDEIMCDHLTYEDLHLASVVSMDDIICDDLTYDDLNPVVFENAVLGLMI